QGSLISGSSEAISMQMLIDPNNPTSFIITGSGNSPIFLSGSGAIGLATAKPVTDVDIRANDFQVQRRAESSGLRVNEEGNIESFDRTAASSATGSELVLRYSRGVTIDINFMSDAFGVVFENDSEADAFFNDLPPDIQTDLLKKGEELGFVQRAQVGDV
ncbi:MAG TPA: hypothetical protein DCM40_20850, partial [Maribacter sp.]|nr:hypothetical protein [Maribacter sp.]